MPEAHGRPPRSPDLAGIVERIWYVADAGQDGRELKLPTTHAQIIINLDADRLSTRRLGPRGPTALSAGAIGLAPIAPSTVLLDRCEQRRAVGVVVRPEAIGTVAGLPAEELDALADLELLWGPAADRIVDAVSSAATGLEVMDRVETALLTMMRGRRVPGAACRLAIAHLRRGEPVAAVAQRVGLSQSALARRFRTQVGMAPKRFQRLLRLERAVGIADQGAPDWSAVAAQCGYVDQPHLVHEFNELTGLTPSQWASASLENPFHVDLDADFLQDPTTAPASG